MYEIKFHPKVDKDLSKFNKSIRKLSRIKSFQKF